MIDFSIPIISSPNLCLCHLPKAVAMRNNTDMPYSWLSFHDEPASCPAQ